MAHRSQAGALTILGFHLIRVEAPIADAAAVFADPCYWFGPGEAIPTHALKRFWLVQAGRVSTEDPSRTKRQKA